MQSTERQKAFLKREGLDLELLSDKDGELARQLELPVWRSPDGERFLDRVTLVFQRGNGLVDVFRNPEPEEHARRALEAILLLSESP